MSTKVETAAEAARLLRAVPEVAIDREWIREKLMVGAEENAIYSVRPFPGAKNPQLVKWTHGQREPATPAGCSEVTGCCAFGFVEIATVCANGFSLATDAYAKDLLARALVELGWAEPVFEAAHANMQDGDYPSLYSFEEWRENIVTYAEWDDVGEEGLVPAWNDHHCTGKEQVLELVARAAEIADREAAA